MFKDSTEVKKFIMFFIRRSITFIQCCSFAFVWDIFYADMINNPFFRKGNWVLIILYMILYHLFTSLYGGYRIGSERITDIVYSNWLTIVIVNFVAYIEISLIDRQLQAVMPLMLLSAFQLLITVPWATYVNRLYFSLFEPKKLICLCNGNEPSRIINKFASKSNKFNIIKTIKVKEEDSIFFDQLKGSDGVVIYDLSDEKLSKVLKYCVENGIRYYLVPTLADIILRTSDIIYLFDTPLLLSKNEGLYMGQKIIKRTFDIFFSIIFLVLLTPIFILISLSIKLNDNGPVIYSHERCTENGKRFKIFKFRTMIVNAEKDGRAVLAKEEDPRITPIGKILRRLRLDELPQLINILKGEMSFVGPRPERPEIIEEYKKRLPEFDLRLSVKCGLTGYAQVLGRYNTTPEEKLKLDLIYIQTYSFLLDIKIILMTLRALLSKESTQGFKKINM
jgi:exopolysaccharide biosynthesis polyprenyl glycosylphosphotransferase